MLAGFERAPTIEIARRVAAETAADNGQIASVTTRFVEDAGGENALDRESLGVRILKEATCSSGVACTVR